MKIKDILKKNIVKDILFNIINLILVVVYFIIFNTQANILDSSVLTNFIDISSMIFLVVSIVMFEIGYRKDKAKIFIYGIEFLALAIFTLLIKHMPKVLGYTMKEYTEIGIYAFIAYYILKSGIQYDSINDIQWLSASE